MKRFVCIFSFVLLAVVVAQGEPKKTEAPPAKASPSASPVPATHEEVAPIELKTKSVFAIEANTRSPFWPIGWKPAVKISNAEVEHAGPDIPVTAFVLSSITIENGAKYAIVNGKIMQEGQQFGLQIGSQTYQITLKRIEDGRVIIARRDQEIAFPLRRK